MSLLDIVILLVLISWLGGSAVHIGGGLIHLLLVVALGMFIFRMATGRKV